MFRRSRRGSVLALAAVVLMILLATGTGLLKLGLNSRLLAISHSSEIEARAAADAGLTKAICLLNQQLAAGTLLRTRSTSDSTYSSIYALPAETNTSLESSDASYTYAVAGNPTSGYTVQCTGTSGRVSKTITSTLKLQSPFDFAVFTDSGLNFGPSSVLDWINFDLDDFGLQIGTNSTENDAIVLGANAVINGDVLVGPGGVPGDVIKDGGAQISGDFGALTSENTLPSIAVPTSLQLTSSSGDIITSKTINASGKYRNIDLSHSDVLKISGAVTLYITDNITLDNSAQIQIDNTTPSSLILYLGGNLEGKNGGSINNLTKDATKFKIYGLDSCDNLRFKNSFELYAAIYAPEADVIFDNSAVAYGSVIADNFEQRNSAAFYYDTNLRDADATDPLITLAVSQWSEGN